MARLMNALRRTINSNWRFSLRAMKTGVWLGIACLVITGCKSIHGQAGNGRDLGLDKSGQKQSEGDIKDGRREPVKTLNPSRLGGGLLMGFSPEFYKDAPLGETKESVCSPRLSSNFTGLVVQAPERIALSGDAVAVVVLCGSYQVSAAQAVGAPPMEIHVRRQSDGAVTSGQLGLSPDDLDEPEIPHPADAPQPSAAALANTRVEGWFHVDAQKWVTMSLTGGRFDISVTYGGARSEPVTVEIVP